MRNLPIIAVSATSDTSSGPGRVRVNASYLRALENAGLVPVVVPPLHVADSAEHVLRVMDGLLLTGGEDVDPVHYGEGPHPRLGRVAAERDRTELALVAAARRMGRPTLAICRGVQLLNVALGGSLIQDLPSQRPSEVAHDRDGERAARVHEVIVEAGSRTAVALGAERVVVNSFHHQALDRVALELRVTGRAVDGVIEAVETPPDHAWWAVGVQWHPEELLGTAEGWDRALFAAFAARVAAANDGAKPR